MLDMPSLKFEKSTNYLNDQLNIQLNNKSLVTDIISNINLLLKTAKTDEKENYLNIQASANLFLNTLSQNITTIEELNIEIKHITYDITEVLKETSKREKSKEYYIAAISNVKSTIESYTVRFQDFEKKLEKDNIELNEFINSNNIQYNFTADHADDSYKFSGFSIVEENNSNSSNTSTEETDLSSNNDNSSKEKSNIEIDYSSVYNNYYNSNKVKSLEDDIFSEYSVFDNFGSSVSKTDTSSLFVLEDNKDSENDKNIEELDNTVSTEESTNEIENQDSVATTSETTDNDYQEPVQSESLENNDSTDDNIVENIEIEDIIDDINIEDLIENTTPDENTSADSIEITDNDLVEEILNDSDVKLSYDDLLKAILEEKVSSENVPNSTQDTTEDLLNDITLDDLLEFGDSNIIEESLIEESNSEPVEEFKKSPTQNKDNSLFALKSKPKKINTVYSDYNLEEQISLIKEGLSNNDSLIISERKKLIFLPYTIDEVERYLKIYPDVYNSGADVIDQEFILPFEYCFRFPTQARFSETYNLIRNRERKSIIYSIMFSLKLAFKSSLNPAIIAACKRERQLKNYLNCLNQNKLEDFDDFKIIYDVNLYK